MDTDRSRDLARLERLEQELALLRDALRRIAAVYDDNERGRPAFTNADCEEMADIAKAALYTWRKEHDDA